jgi:hypothetical protein
MRQRHLRVVFFFAMFLSSVGRKLGLPACRIAGLSVNMVGYSHPFTFVADVLCPWHSLVE